MSADLKDPQTAPEETLQTPDTEETEYVYVDENGNEVPAPEEAEDEEYLEDEDSAADDAEYEYVIDEDDDDDDYEYVAVEDDAADDNDDDDDSEYVYIDENGNEVPAPESAEEQDDQRAAGIAAATAAAVGAAAAGKNAAPEEHEETPEEKAARLKKEKHERVRRNLRIIALVVAGYYFISAGYSWYQEKQAEDAKAANAMINAAAVANALNDPAAFRERFNSAINLQRSSLPTANANDSTEGFVAVLSPAIELRGVLKPGSQDIDYLQLQTRYPAALPPESLNALRAFVLACENSQDLKLADDIITALGIIPQNDANEADKIFDPAQAQSQTVRYELSFSSGEIDELTVRAYPRL